jgi:hypothetical protein
VLCCSVLCFGVVSCLRAVPVLNSNSNSNSLQILAKSKNKLQAPIDHTDLVNCEITHNTIVVSTSRSRPRVMNVKINDNVDVELSLLTFDSVNQCSLSTKLTLTCW